jgi:hypothetical protein
MSRGYKFANFDTFQPVENMNETVRAQQYAYNGRMFIPPSTDAFSMDADIGKNGLNTQYQSRYDKQGLISPIESDETIRPYELYKNSNSKQNTSVNIISNIVVPNALSRTFFSNDNVERIQSQIVNNVYKQSQKVISRQSYQELQIIMKSIYLQYGRNLPNNIEEQVFTLNKYVIDECVSIIIPNVIQYGKYITEITGPIPINPRSMNVSNKGDKSLPGPGTQI